MHHVGFKLATSTSLEIAWNQLEFPSHVHTDKLIGALLSLYFNCCIAPIASLLMRIIGLRGQRIENKAPESPAPNSVLTKKGQQEILDLKF